MKDIHYDALGYDPATGRPTAESLEQRGLARVAKAL